MPVGLYNMEKEQFIIYTDGGARGNPGPAAIGVVLKDASGHILKEYGEAIGEATNNEAEYRAVIFALEKAKSVFGKKKAKEATVIVRMDSELVSRQLNGEYKIEEERLAAHFLKIWNLKIDFGEVIFHHVPREENKQADRMVNKALDLQARTLF